MRRTLTKTNVIGTLPVDAKASILNVVQSGQLSRLSPIMWTTLELRRQGVSENFHLLTDIARNIWTTAYYVSIEQDGHGSSFARFNSNSNEWEPDGTMGFCEEQGMFYNRMLCADLVRTLKELGFIDVTQRMVYDYLLPLSKTARTTRGDPSHAYMYEQKFSAMSKLVENSPFVIPDFLRPYRIGKEKYARIVQYVRQCVFIASHWTDILKKADWQRWASVSDEYREHAMDMSWEFRSQIGL